MGGYAWVTLATNNSYSLGALVLAHSLKKANTAHNLAVLITPAVSESMREQLRTVFDVVKVVDVLDSKDEAHLALMKRPDLGITFTKIHCWRLIEFEKCVFLDADTLVSLKTKEVVRNCDELFEREEFSAAPDVSWPDCFNSGVFVYRPSIETFNKLLQFAVENKSFDGGDQGLLNQYFSDWATEDIKKHLPFVYNLTSVAVYSYIPAFKHYGAETRIVHFIGHGKPWLQQVDAATRTVSPTSGSEHLTPMLQQWWDLFCEKVHPNLDKNLESSNNGMPHSHLEACSNPLPVAIIDESHTPRLIEPCTPYREKDDFRQYNLPYQPFDVKGSSGELLNEEFLLASVVSPTALEVCLDEQQRQNRDKKDEQKVEEKNESDRRNEEIKKIDEILKSDIPINQESYTVQEPEKGDEEKKPGEEKDKDKEEEEEEKGVEEQIQDLEPQPKPDDPPPSEENTFENNSFFPDETCIYNYLERNVKTYQPFDNHHNHHHHHHHHHTKHHQARQHQVFHESHNVTNSSNDNQEVEQNTSFLPRFLTLPEDDRRQSGNVGTRFPERDLQNENKVLLEATFENKETTLSIENHPPEEQILSRDDVHTEHNAEKRELTKSKSMPYLPCDNTVNEPPSPPLRSIWKSQPGINADLTRKYSMPKLKPILPKQNSFSKSIPSAMPKVTQYTEFLMSSEYKDPIDLPKDKVDFVEMHIHKEANLRRSKSEVNIRSKFGPLPYALSPETKKPVTPKKIPLRHLENELYDLTQCKRQLGNKPKPKSTDQKKENIRTLPALKPIVPAKGSKSTIVKKRKSKKLSPEDEKREKISKRDPEVVRERKRIAKPAARNVSMEANKNDLDEILNRLREFSKNYQHFFGAVTETNKKTVKCTNTSVQVSEQDEGNECTSSEIFETFSKPVSTSSRKSQTGEEALYESSEFRQFRNYVKDQREASQKGLLSLQEIISDKEKRESIGLLSSKDGKEEMKNGKNFSAEIKNDAKEGNEIPKLAEVCSSPKAKDGFIHSRRESSEHQSSSESKENECNHKTHIEPNLIDTSTSTNIIPRPTDCSSNDCESNTVSLLHRAEDSSLNLSALRESSEIKAIETRVQLLSEPCNTISSYTCRESSKTDEIVCKHSEEQTEHEANVSEETNIPLNSTTSEECNRNSKRTTENQKILNDEQIIVGPSKECQSLNESESSLASSSAASENFTNSKGIFEEELHREKVSSTESRKQEIEEQSCTSETGCNVELTRSPTRFRYEEINHETSNPNFEQKDGKIASVPYDEQRDDDSSESLNVKSASQEERRDDVPNEDDKTKAESKKDEKSKEEENDPKVFYFGKTGKVVEEYKIPKNLYCSRDLGTPQCFSSSISRKNRKPRSRPKKTLENGLKNQNKPKISSNDSSDGTNRVIGTKSYDKKLKRKTPAPSGFAPCGGNSQPEDLEDLRGASGIAGAIAQLNLESGSDRSPESIAASTAHQEYLRRQNWETGNMDYMGKDSFDNIWSKICQTIEAKESEERVAGSSNPSADTSVISGEAEKIKKAAQPENTVSLYSIPQKCPEYISTLPGEPDVGPVEDDEIIFSKPVNKQSCLTNVAEEEVGIDGSAASAVPLSAAKNVKLSDILQPRHPLGGDGVTQIESSSTCDKQRVTGTHVQEAEKEKAEKVPPGEESKNVPETFENVSKSAKPLAGDKPQSTTLPTEIKSQSFSAEKPECKTVAICQPPIQIPQAPSSSEQNRHETQVRAAKPEEKTEECKTVAIPSPPVVYPGAPSAEKEKRQFKPEKKPNVELEPIPLPPPDSPTVVPEQEPTVTIASSDSLKDENKQKKGVFTKILEMVGVSPKEKNGNEISKSVFYDTEGCAVLQQTEADNQTTATEENEASAEKVEIKQSTGDAQIVEEAKKAEEEKTIPPAEPHAEPKELPPLEAREKKSEIISQLKEFEETEETKAQEITRSDESQEQKPPAKETEKPSGVDPKSKNQSKKQKSGRGKPARNASPKELKTPVESAQASATKGKSSSPKLTMPQNLPETEITTPTPPPQPELTPRKNSAMLKVDDSILETPPVPEPSKESIDESDEGKASKKMDIMEKAKSEVESLLQDIRSEETEAGENSDLINTMKLMMGGEQTPKAAQEDVEELRVTSEEERKQHKGEVVSSKLSDQILKAIPPPRRKAISEASASTSAIPKPSAAPEQKNPPAESKSKASKSSSMPVPPPRSRGKPTQPAAPSKGKGKK